MNNSETKPIKITIDISSSHALAWECVFQVILQYAFPSRTMELEKESGDSLTGALTLFLN